MIEILTAFGVGLTLGAVLASVGVAVIGPVFTEHLALRRQFFAPFRRWCARMNGSVNELLHWTSRLPVQGSPQWPLTYHMLSNFLEVHDLLAEADEKGWSTALVDGEYTLQELSALREAVDDLYHSTRLENDGLWSELPTKEARLKEENVSQIADICVTRLSEPNVTGHLERLCQRLESEIPK